VFTDEAGVEVAIVDAHSDTGEITLIRVTGTESSLDGKVLAHRREIHEGGPLRFVTQLRGDDYVTVWAEDYPRASGFRLELPESKTAIHLTRSPSLSSTLELEAVVEQHRKQEAEGLLARLRQFDRPAETAAMKRKVADRAARYLEACELELPLEVAWDTFSNEELRDWRLDDRCTTALWAMKRLCEHQVAREAFRSGTGGLACIRGDEMAIELAGRTLTWTASADPMNASQFARDYLLDQAVWPGEGTLAQRITIERTAVCSDGKGHFVGVRPRHTTGEELFFGTAKELRRVRESPWGISGHWFFEPREFNPNNNPSFRGTDLRYFSHLNIDRDAGTCAVVCGERRVPMKLLAHEVVRDMLDKIEIGDPLPIRRPYALARDRRGTYYFVDTGEEAHSQTFRLLAGPKGALVEIEMVNIASDSHGDVFSTESGSLRLVLEKNESFWVKKGKTEKLLNVPLQENWGVIYNDLGVYKGQPLGTPCDEL
jgi:hypothetical protein